MLKLKTKLIILMCDNGKSYASVAKRTNTSKQWVSKVMDRYYKSPYGQRQLRYKLKRYHCEVCGQPKRQTLNVDGLIVDMCNECALALRRGNKHYYPNRFDWSINYPECVECQSTKYPHMAHGRCKKCYPRFKRGMRTLNFRKAI